MITGIITYFNLQTCSSNHWTDPLTKRSMKTSINYLLLALFFSLGAAAQPGTSELEQRLAAEWPQWGCLYEQLRRLPELSGAQPKACEKSGAGRDDLGLGWTD